MGEKIRISGIQMNIFDDIELNLKTADELIEKSRGEIVCLPELFSTGFRQDAINFAEDKNGKTFKFLKEISAKKKILLIGGITEKNEDKPYNSLFVFENGNLIGKYRKIHLFKHFNEHVYYSPGNKIFVFESKKIKTKIGLMICYDLRFPEIAKEIRKKGGKIIFVSANFPDKRKSHWMTLLKARAIENLCFVIGVNANIIHNKYIDEKFGNTVCFDPWGRKIKGEIKNFENGKIFEFEINPERVEHVRKKYKFLE